MSLLLQLTGINKSYGNVQALKDVSFDLYPGEVHAIVGENGAGKSTLIKVITGAQIPDSGTIQIRGETVIQNDPVRARQLGIAAIYQRPALFPDLTVAENIAFGVESKGPWKRIRWGAIRDRARQLLDRIGASIDCQSLVRTLSMPEQQLVEIAKALGANAKIVIMDEPTASLSNNEVERLFRSIADLKSHGVGVIYISHRLEELPRVADRVTALRDGCRIDTRAMTDVSRDSLIQMMVGRDVSTLFPNEGTALNPIRATARERVGRSRWSLAFMRARCAHDNKEESKTGTVPGDVVLSLRGLGCRASGIHDCDLDIRAGEIVGLAGLIGSGRSELARTLFGLTPADRGTISLHGREVAIASPSRAVSLGLAYVPEDRIQHGVIAEMSIASNITLATLAAHSTLGLIQKQRERTTAQKFVDELDVKTTSTDALVSSLSGGNQQKVVLARWLASAPSVLILDEPTQGVDIGAKAEIHKLLNDLAQAGLAILMISSELPEILAMSDRIAVMSAGTIIDCFDRATATQELILQRALGQHLLAEKEVHQ